MQHFGFAMDQGERATFVTSFVTGHLENNQRSEKGECEEITNDSS